MLNYQSCVESGAQKENSLQEDFVQRLWFEEAFVNPLTTVTGEKIQVVQSGFWNRQSGPDFSQACILNEKGEQETGSVEIHLEPRAWEDHGHRDDPNYQNVILHVFWENKGKQFFTRTNENKRVRQVELKNQLKQPLEKLLSAFYGDIEKQKAIAHEGMCADVLKNWDKEKILELLESAGQYRFQKKAQLWFVRSQIWGYEQALWVGIAEALGYSVNKEPFHLLAQRLKIKDILKSYSQTHREALLFGMAGFLPKKVLPDEKKYARALWDEWWKERDQKSISILPEKIWKLTGMRPLNRPERRLSALSLISEKKKWKKLKEFIRKAEIDALQKEFFGLSHPFWNRHFTLRSKMQTQKYELIGSERMQAMLFNILLPFCAQFKYVDEELKNLNPSPYGQKFEFVKARLLGKRRISFTRLAQEGLLQIHDDLCAQNNHLCERCDFLKTSTAQVMYTCE